MIRLPGLVFCVTFGMLAPVAGEPGAGPIPAAATQPADPTFVFSQAVARYVTLVHRLHGEVPPLRVTAESAEIDNRSNMLAGAIQRARPWAAQGDFFDTNLVRVIRARLAVALEGEDLATVMKRIEDDPAPMGPANVYLRFPAGTSLATMPSRLIEVLPALPKELEYRFLGRTLILRDRDAAMILDYVPEALPKAS